jgi:hypothetical protein
VGDGDAARMHIGIVNDMCSGGVGIITKHCFYKGDRISVTLEGFSKLSITGTVRWCSRCTEQLFRVGIDIS